MTDPSNTVCVAEPYTLLICAIYSKPPKLKKKTSLSINMRSCPLFSFSPTCTDLLL